MFLTLEMLMPARYRPWDSLLKIIRSFLPNVERNSVVELFRCRCSLVLKRSAPLRSHRKTCMVRNFLRGVLTKQIFKNIRGDSAFSKTCNCRTATSLKRDFDTGVFLWVCQFFQNSFFIEHLWTAPAKAVYTTE